MSSLFRSTRLTAHSLTLLFLSLSLQLTHTDTDGQVVDSKCRALTASWARQRAGVIVRQARSSESDIGVAASSSSSSSSGNQEDVPMAMSAEDIENAHLCQYFEEFDRTGKNVVMPQG